MHLKTVRLVSDVPIQPLAGGLTRKYAARFPEIHRGMPHLQMVPGFSWVYIHVGNDDDDTEGCILVGDGAELESMTIQRSVREFSGASRDAATPTVL